MAREERRIKQAAQDECLLYNIKELTIYTESIMEWKKKDFMSRVPLEIIF